MSVKAYTRAYERRGGRRRGSYEPDSIAYKAMEYIRRCWSDCSDATDVDAATALAKWAAVTEGGTKRTRFASADIDYYRIFPGDVSIRERRKDG
jgi:hypothetical protein